MTTLHPVKLSAAQVVAVDIANDAGGELHRYLGNFWARDGISRRPPRDDRASPATVEALVRRGVFSVAQRLHGLPVLVKLHKAYRSGRARK